MNRKENLTGKPQVKVDNSIPDDIVVIKTDKYLYGVIMIVDDDKATPTQKLCLNCKRPLVIDDREYYGMCSICYYDNLEQ